METIADLREQVQVLARRNQLLMDDHDEIVRIHHDLRPATPPLVATPVQVPVPLPIPVPIPVPAPLVAHFCSCSERLQTPPDDRAYFSPAL